MVDTFELNDLSTGMVVRLRGTKVASKANELYLVMRGIKDTHASDILVCKNGWIRLSEYDNNLLMILRFGEGEEVSQYDIIEVYTPRCEASIRLMLGSNDFNFEEDYKLLWKREEPSVEMTVAEIEKKLGIKNLKIVKEHEDE